MEKIRLQKVLSSAGVASRRAAEKLISEGKIKVNGEVVDRQGMRVDPEIDKISVEGKQIWLGDIVNGAGKITYLLNKPKYVISAMKSDPNENPDDYYSGEMLTLADVLPKKIIKQGLFHAGRLDYKTTGLLILTNDGDLANRITHPSFEIHKKYFVIVNKELTPEKIKQLRNGIKLEDGITKVDKIQYVGKQKNLFGYQLTIHSGKNRIIRRLFESLDIKVIELKRTQIGQLRIGDLKSGEYRLITEEEIRKLYE